MNELFVSEFWKLAVRDTCFPVVSPTSQVETFHSHEEYLDHGNKFVDCELCEKEFA